MIDDIYHDSLFFCYIIFNFISIRDVSMCLLYHHNMLMLLTYLKFYKIDEIKAHEEEIKNQEFEKNNSEFCQQFMTDMKERKKITEKKQESANMLRLKGNNYFKLKKFDKALELYYDAMKESPFDAKLVNNIAQVINTK